MAKKGFEKFKDKLMGEAPIVIDMPVKEGEGRVGRPVLQEEPERPQPRGMEVRQVKAGRPRREEKVVSTTVMLPEEVRNLLNEMKYRSSRKIQDLVSEAVRDLYDKLYR